MSKTTLVDAVESLLVGCLSSGKSFESKMTKTLRAWAKESGEDYERFVFLIYAGVTKEVINSGDTLLKLRVLNDNGWRRFSAFAESVLSKGKDKYYKELLNAARRGVEGHADRKRAN